eukprot:Skav213754  [mRNA]  locus=scaffold258:206675:207022:- [translate_table: standard]
MSQAQVPLCILPKPHLQSESLLEPSGAVLLAGQVLHMSKPRSSLNLSGGQFWQVAPVPCHPGRHLQSCCGKNLLGVTFKVALTKSLHAKPPVSSRKACMLVVFITPCDTSFAASS